ncbi:MAG: filamentous hemagglutinin, partial [Alphaproteobacteria bacterium]|nr:filamentous hemagglutinin [Alphaproteobacteria bacterium]
EVTGTSDLGADVKTTGNQTYTGAATISADITLTTTSNGTVSFVSTTDSDATDRTLAITTNGTGDVSFTGAVGGTGGLNGLTIDTNQFNAAALTVGGTISITNTDTASSEITGVIANDGDAAVLTKAGTGILTLSGTNTYTGITTISAGTLSISADAGLGSISSLDADRLTFNGGTLLITETITLNTNRGVTLTGNGTINVANTKTVTYDGVITGVGQFTKDGNGILDLGGTNTYTGATNINDGELNVTGALAATAVTVASGATYDADTTDTIGSISGAGSIEINTGTTLTVGGNDTDTTFSGVISGDGNLTKEGSGTLTLSGTNTNTGTLTVNEGGLTLDQAATNTGTVLHDDSNLTLNAGAITVSDTSETVYQFTYNGG